MAISNAAALAKPLLYNNLGNASDYSTTGS